LAGILTKTWNPRPRPRTLVKATAKDLSRKAKPRTWDPRPRPRTIVKATAKGLSHKAKAKDLDLVVRTKANANNYHHWFMV